MNYLNSYADETFNMSGFTRTVVIEGGSLMGIFPPTPDLSSHDGTARVHIIVNDVLERPLHTAGVVVDIASQMADWKNQGLDTEGIEAVQAFKINTDMMVTAEIMRLCREALVTQCERYGVEVDYSVDVHTMLDRVHEKAMAAYVSDKLMDAALVLDDQQFADAQETLMATMNMVDGLRDRAAAWTPITYTENNEGTEGTEGDK